MENRGQLTPVGPTPVGGRRPSPLLLAAGALANLVSRPLPPTPRLI